MAEKKLVLKIKYMTDDRAKRKAIEAAADSYGVDYIAANILEQKIKMIGDFDPFSATKKLKKLGQLEIISVGPAEEKKMEEKMEEKNEEKKEEGNSGVKSHFKNMKKTIESEPQAAVSQGWNLAPASNVLSVQNTRTDLKMQKFLQDVAKEKPIRFTEEQLRKFTSNFSTRLFWRLWSGLKRSVSEWSKDKQ